MTRRALPKNPRHRKTNERVILAECAPIAAFFSAACRRSSSILRLLKPREESSLDGCQRHLSWSQAQPGTFAPSGELAA
jgi:hypothetical protein